MRRQIILFLLVSQLALEWVNRVCAQPCDPATPLKPEYLVLAQQTARATLIGFSELTTPAAPPRKFRREKISGTMTVGNWGNAGCPIPDYAPSYGEGGSLQALPGDPFYVTWSAAFVPVAEAADGSVNFKATTFGQHINPGGGPPQPFDVFIYVGGAQSGNFDDVIVANGNIVTLRPNASAPYTVFAFSNALFGAALPVHSAVIMGPRIPQTRDVWDFVREYDGADPTGATFVTDKDSSVHYSGTSATFPFADGVAAGAVSEAGYAGLVAEALSATSRRLSGTGLCRVDSLGTRRAVGAVETVLSVEDTDEDAAQRARYVPGAVPVAYRTRRATGFEFDLARVDYEARFRFPCKGQYVILVRYSVKPHGSDDPGVRQVASRVMSFPEGVQTVTGRVEIGRGDHPELNELDVDYTIEGLEAQSLCPAGEPGGLSARLGSVHVQLSLGRASGDTAAGELRLDAEEITSVLFTPAMLTLAAPTGEVTQAVRTTSGVLRQVRAPQTFADILSTGPARYEVRFYSPAQVGSWDPANRVFAMNGTPFATYVVENPDAGEGLTTRLRITEIRGASTRVTEYAFDAMAREWTLDQGGGLRTESTTTETVGRANDTLKTTTVRDRDGGAASCVARTYHAFPWGEELIREVVDPDGAALTTDFVYYDAVPAADPNYRHLRQRTNADGSWERFTYDSAGRILKATRPFLNTAPDVSDDRLCRVEERSFDPLPDADGDSLPEGCVATVSRCQGIEISRGYRIEWSQPVNIGADVCKRRTDIRCVKAGATWDAADNLNTETLEIATGSLAGRERRVTNPDGTVTLTAFALASDGQLVTTVSSGQPNVARDDIIDGRRTITVTSAGGQIVSETVTDIATGLTLSARVATEFDWVGRPIRIESANGTFTTRTFACCGLASQRDETGVVTTYDHDALGRLTEVSRLGIRTRTEYDAEGHVLRITRIGADSSEIVQESNRYDLAGRLIEKRDALGRSTTYMEFFDASTGQTTRTTTAPDGATTIEVYARDGSLLSVTGSAAAPRLVEHGIDADGQFLKETRVGADAGGQETTGEWTKTYVDFAGRTARVVYADGAVASLHYNEAGQLDREVDPDGVTTLFGYNARGVREIVAIDLNANGGIDFGGVDRINRETSMVTTKTEGEWSYVVERTLNEVWQTEGQDQPTTTSVTEQTLDGLRLWRTVDHQTTKMVTTLEGAGDRTITTTTPDGVRSSGTFHGDRLISTSETTASGLQLKGTSYGYDAHGRLETVTDLRNGAATCTYFADDRIDTITTPDPDETRSGPGYDPQVTAHVYDSAGRITEMIGPDGGIVHVSYWPTGAVKRTWGARTIPTEFSYDPQGRLQTMTTWQDFRADAGKAVTRWEYDPVRGFLQRKRYVDDTGPHYSHTSAGRIRSRTWARMPAVTSKYEYTAGGDLESISYSDSTPGVAINYDRTGRPSSIRDGSGWRTLDYHTSGQLARETYLSGPFAGTTVGRTFDALNRLSELAVAGVATTSFTYDAASRLDTVKFGENTATYGYGLKSPLMESLVFKNAGVTRLITSRQYDHLDRLTTLSHSAGVNSPTMAYAATYNAANQRTRTTREDGSYWRYDYDPLGQLVAGKKFLADDRPVPGYDRGWSFDDIGNRVGAKSNGTTSDYAANLLNQYLRRSIPGVIDVTGAAAADATVTISAGKDFPQPVARQGEAFHRQVSVENAMRAVTVDVRVSAVKNAVGPAGQDVVSEVQREVLVPKSPEAFGHDADGNLTDDARWHYFWDGENRLSALETSEQAAATGRLRQRIEYTYDSQHRRVSRKVSVANDGDWVVQSHALYVYDEWNVLAELDALGGGRPQRTFAWGLDLSGTFQGAGGVGGLLFASLPSENEAGLHVHACTYDSTANVIGLVSMRDGRVSATYDYDAFGGTLRTEGPAALSNPFRFSTKRTDPETGDIYFGHRCYDPNLGRFLSRDPLQEEGGANLFQFAANAPTVWTDPLGLALYAFDGTNNDRIRDDWAKKSENGPTNVAILYDLYNEQKSYAVGVGTNDGLLNPLGLAGGLGGKARIQKSLSDAQGFITAGNLVVDITGFSRGAAEARDFANQLKKKFPCIRIRWMGLFDTVASFGLGGNDIDLGYDFSIPVNAYRVFHLTAGGENGERRKFFPLMSVKAGPSSPNSNPNVDETVLVDAAHSDVGGGYRENRGLANYALFVMWQDGRSSGVPFDSIPSRYANFVGTEHDSRWRNDRAYEFFRGRRKRKIFYSP